MPSKNFGKGKPYRARIRLYGQDFYLGTFNTYEEAKQAEEDARNKRPSRRGQRLVI